MPNNYSTINHKDTNLHWVGTASDWVKWRSYAAQMGKSMSTGDPFVAQAGAVLKNEPTPASLGNCLLPALSPPLCSKLAPWRNIFKFMHKHHRKG